MRILYVNATFVPPPTNRQADRFYLLSEKLEGDVLQPVWFKTPEQVEAVFGPGSYPVYTVGRFRYHWFLALQHEGVWNRLATFRFYVQKGLQLLREHSFDCLVAYSHMTTGLCAGLLKLLRGGKLIIEIVTEPETIYLTMRPRPNWRERVMHFYSDLCLHLSMFLSDRLHLLYPNQVSRYSRFHSVFSSVFPDFVPISSISRSKGPANEDLYILLLGAPWYLKGVDRIIEAFRKLSPDFPDVKLKIIGHYPDRKELEALAGGSPQIEILKAVPNAEVLPIVSGAAMMVLPSRCEGVPRVFMEAMAAGIPVIGSDVGGIPYVVKDGENGYVIPGGDPHLLEQRLRYLLSNPEERRQMGDSGFDRAHSDFGENKYVERFAEMVECAVGGNRGRADRELAFDRAQDYR